MKKDKLTIFFVILQGIFTLATLITIIIYFFNSNMKIIIPFFFGITLFILSFNNYRIYKKKALTITYLIFGILCIIYGIIRLGI